MRLSIAGYGFIDSMARALRNRFAVTASLICFFTVSSFAARPEHSSIHHEAQLIVHEGTDMALTVSPDHTRMIIDLQGLLYELPIKGGVAKRLTAPELEASHPSW